ncbi:hypothetical protein [Ammoniphilus sp. CFH 90114]|nr:hypothetical protein [Ammoniphilus sp. CFH 90114]
MKSNVATAHLLIRIVYQVLKTKKPYQELGYDYLEREQGHKKEQKMI